MFSPGLCVSANPIPRLPLIAYKPVQSVMPFFGYVGLELAVFIDTVHIGVSYRPVAPVNEIRFIKKFGCRSRFGVCNKAIQAVGLDDTDRIVWLYLVEG